MLIRPETLARYSQAGEKSAIGDAPIEESDIDALWFVRPPHAGREAWELRLVSETPYALFQAFEAGEEEAVREEMRREMVEQLREYQGRSSHS